MAAGNTTESCSATTSAKAAHVNMMTDTVIANLPPEALRSILRGLLGIDAKVTPAFHCLAAQYLSNTRSDSMPTVFTDGPAGPIALSSFEATRNRYRCLMGCGYGFESLEILSEIIVQTLPLVWNDSSVEGLNFMDLLALIDSDLVQALTAVQKELSTSVGKRLMSTTERKTVEKLRNALLDCKKHAESNADDFAFQRGLSRLERLQSGLVSQIPVNIQTSRKAQSFVSRTNDLEIVKLGEFVVPRMFMGLWQFSSPAWGTASRSKINSHFRKHVDAGLIAYDDAEIFMIDMADHYGDAEVTFGQFRSSQKDSNQIYCGTKWCVFEPITISQEAVEANIEERLRNINAENVELLQFHWQDYNDHQYIKATQLIERDPRVRSLGLCNFDTKHMNEILESGVKIVSNQVQFSLIDLRPTFKMADSCRKHNVKLLTYGSLCGGLLADKWLAMPTPNLFDANMTPSHRKYLEMIMAWGGWALFQELLSTLSTIGKIYGVSISTVAIRWVLDHDYVGAVIIGARMGITEHIEENLKVFTFKLNSEDMCKIQNVLDKCRAREVFEAMGDCGSEYRQ